MTRYIEDNHYDTFYQQPTSHFIYGDATDCFYWACQLAQTTYSESGQQVFMTSATKEDFMAEYQNERCLVILGVNPQDVPAEDLRELLRPSEDRIFMGTDVNAVCTVILTAHTDTDGMSIAYRNQRSIWEKASRDFEYIYEVRNAGKFGIADITTYQYKNGTLAVVAAERGADLLLLLDQKNSANDFFEKYNYGKLLIGMPEDMNCFLRQVKYLAVYEQQKLWALMNSHEGTTVSSLFAKHCLKHLRSCKYDPALRTVEDCGYQQIKELGGDHLKSELHSFIDFKHAGNTWLEDEAQKGGQLTPFGYIDGFPPYNVQQEFVIPIDTERLYFEADFNDMVKLGVPKLPF